MKVRKWRVIANIEYDEAQTILKKQLSVSQIKGFNWEMPEYLFMERMNFYKALRLYLKLSKEDLYCMIYKEPKLIGKE